MKVKDMIAKLQTFDPELPIAIADWNEQYRGPSEGFAELVSLGSAETWVQGRYKQYLAVVIGS